MPQPDPHSSPRSDAGPVGATPHPPGLRAGDGADALRRLRERSDELDRQAVELISRRAELDAQADALARERAECDRLRGETLRAKGEYERLTALVAQRESQGLKILTDRAELIAGREKELERRILLARNDVVAQRARLDAERAEIAALRQQLERDRAALSDAQLALDQARGDWQAHLRELDRRAAQLAQREAALAQTLEDFAAERAQARQVLAQRHAAEADLADRQRACEGREHELERRIQKARDELVRQRADVAAARQAADAHSERLAREARELEERTAALKDESDALGGRLRALEQAEARLAADRADQQRRADELESVRRTLADARRRLAADQERLAQGAAALEARGKTLAEEARRIETLRTEQTRAANELARRQAESDRAAAELADERRRAAVAADSLATRETELLARANELELERARLRDAQGELAARRAELEARLAQVEERDAESAQRALAIEVEADQLAHERAVVEFAQEELAGLREQREAEFESLRDALRARESRVADAERSAFAAPSLWLLRAAGIAAVFAAAAGGLWLRFEPVIHEASARISISTQRASPDAAVREHAAALLSAELAPRWLKDGVARDLWTRARDAGRLRAELVPDPPAIDLVIRADTPDAAQRAASDLADRYVAHVNAVPRAALLPAIYRDLVERRDATAAELDRLLRQRTEASTLLALCPPAERRDQVSAEVHGLRDAHVAVLAELDRQRANLSELQAGAVVRGVVTDDDLSAALASDEMHRADSAEHVAEARLLRAELAAGLVPLSDRLGAWKSALRTFRDAVESQRALAPPANIAALLEGCLMPVHQHLAATDECLARWATLRGRVAAADIERDSEALLALQTDAGEAAEAFADRGAETVAAVAAQLDNLRGGADGGTRERVVAAALQTELERLTRALNELRRAASAATLSGNFQLDARDRRVRGLRARLQQRRDVVREELQRRADAQAALRRESLLADTRAEVARLEQEREALASRQLDALDALRSLEQAVLERRHLEAEIQRDDRDIASLSAQRSLLDAQLADAERGGPQPDRASLVSLTSSQVSGRFRWRNAAAVAAGAFMSMLMLCAFMVLRIPLRRGARHAAAVATAPVRAAG